VASLQGGILRTGLGDGYLAPFTYIPGFSFGGVFGELADLDGDLLPEIIMGNFAELRVTKNVLLP
jgi:hypothetical protein